MSKPFHLMTPAERTAARIAENKAIAERIALAGKPVKEPKPSKRPPAAATTDYVRETPEERAAHRSGPIRKIE